MTIDNIVYFCHFLIPIAVGTWLVVTKLVARFVPALRHRPAVAAPSGQSSADLDTAEPGSVGVAGPP